MWLVALKDLQWRRRRFAIALVSTTLVLAMTQLLAGMAASFHNEEHRTITAVHADAWVVPSTASGPFSLTAVMGQEAVARVRTLPGVRDADALILARAVVNDQGSIKDVNLVGYRLGGLGAPPHVKGRLPAGPGEMVIDARAHIGLGKVVEVGGRRMRVVGITHGMTYYVGVPSLYTSLADAQALAFSGKPLVTTVVTRGTPRRVPPDLASLNDAQVIKDLHRRIGQAGKTIGFVSAVLWIVAAGIIGSIVYLSSLERVRDFAVFKATGAATARLLGGLVVQALMLAVGAAILSIGLALVLAPYFPLAVEIPRQARYLLFALATGVATVACIGGIRRVLGIDPALAFEGA